MLAIGRALMTNPRLLMLDEATEGLAPLVRDEIWHTIRVVRDSGIAVVVVDKTVSAVLSLADSVTVLVKGGVVYSGTPQVLREDAELMHRHLGDLMPNGASSSSSVAAAPKRSGKTASPPSPKVNARGGEPTKTSSGVTRRTSIA